MEKPFIIAEMSGNHNQSLERALEIVEAAAAAGADAIKLQTYTADTMTLNLSGGDFLINDPKSLWYKENLYSLYEKAHTPWEWHKPIFDYSKSLGITAFSTPFDKTAVDFLESLETPIYKIAAFENGDLPLLKYIASKNKPLIMSLGMIGLEEINESVSVLKENGCKDITLLKCTSSYPAPPELANLLTIGDLAQKFPDCKIGLSDHTQGIGVAVGAAAMGAEVIEKHFTLSRADGGVDSAFSLEPDELKMLIIEAKRAYKARGKVNYELSESEKKSLVFRRSIYVCNDIKMGEAFTEENIRCIRPGYGLHPRYYEETIGKKAVKDLAKGTPLRKEDIK
ncbi:MAG: pseudaminic acid synthase [Candidatus Riflebacteria bacterium]|nr:pseudaminic acid synthase [Candidatus Riflebacteria bacterium]